MKNINDWTRQEFEALPNREWNQDIGEFDSMVILPTKHTHDSGYKCMDFVAVRKGVPFVRLSGCSDVLHINGISGHGRLIGRRFATMVPAVGWSIDCLRRSKLLQIFSSGVLTCGTALSSFEVYATKQN